MVYVINADESCYSSLGLSTGRNQLFTAITRSKAWAGVMRVGADMDKLVTEFSSTKANNFTLDFIYPKQQQRKFLNIINRDISSEDKRVINIKKDQIKDILEKIQSREIFLEDFSSDISN